MEDTSKKFCEILLDVMHEKGVRDIVCSPGSRNVPLLIAAAARPNMRKHFATDERNAAFMGLGLSLVSKKPVGLICTSGTALLNYAPAVAEAYYHGIPLIVISADRPIQWIDQDDSQTLRQDGVLSNYVKQSYSIPSLGDDDKELQWYVNRIANDALLQACGDRPGPVHINIHLSEPLGEKITYGNNNPRVINSLQGDTIGNKETVKALASKLAESKVLLVAGFSVPDSNLQKEITRFIRRPNVAVMAETISNLHLHEDNYCIDSVLTAYDSELLNRMAPDLVVTMGGAQVSRKLKEYLRRNAHKCESWSVGYSPVTSDPFMSLTLKIEADPTRFFRNINSAINRMRIKEGADTYNKDWAKLRKEASEVKGKMIKDSPWSELKAFHILLNRLPSDYNLFLSNGTAVRYAQIIRYPLPHASYCNRGVSGIDGNVSTAIGGSLSFKGNTLLISGDLSMAYDIGALGLREIPDRFKIIVIDNQGGGIFRFIPTTSSLQEREEYLCQTPLLPLRELASGYGWEYFEAENEIELEENFDKFIACRSKAILKVRCDGQQSADILKKYMKTKV